LYSQFQ